MAEQLKPMSVNPGDPITSELMASIVANINIINSLANKTVSATADGSTPTVQIIESNTVKVPAKTDGTGKSTSIVFTKKFSKRPHIVCTIWQTSGQNFIKQKYIPVVTAASSTEFTISMLPVGATMNGEMNVQWVACSG